MKKAFSVLLCLAMLLSLTACKDKDQKNCPSCDKLIPATANFCEYCGAKTQANDTTENLNTNTNSSQQETYEKFEGSFTNDGKTERTKTINKILSTIEEQKCTSEKIKENTTLGDIIYYHVSNPLDCFPSAQNPVYSVIIDIGGTSILGIEAYDVYYIIGVGNGMAIDLYYTVSYDFKEVVCREVAVREIGGGQEHYSYWYEDHSAEAMNNALYSTAALYMPNLATTLDTQLSDDPYAPSWYNAYRKILTQAVDKYPNYLYSCNYSMFDIDKDSFPELFLKTGTCEADYEYNVYSYIQSSDEAKHLASFGGGFSTICGLGEEKVFLIHYGHQGYERITKCSFENGSLKQEIIFENEIVNYHEFVALPYYEIDNHSGLYWNENAYENNQRVLDTYSLEGGGNNNGSFSDLIVNPSYMWQGDDVFSTFFAEYFANNEAVHWEHLGINGDYFTLPDESEPTWVDVYRVYASDGSPDRYYIIPYGEIQLTEVYEATNKTDVKLVWSIPLNEYYDWMN